MNIRHLILPTLTLGLALTVACQNAAGSAPLDPANTTYLIDNQPVTLTGGVTATPAATETKLLRDQAAGDLDGDGAAEQAVVLARTPAGGGPSYYVAVLGKRGASNAVLLGDRIGAARLSIADRTLTIEYLTHVEGPSPAPAKVVRTLTLQTDQLVEQAPLTAIASGPSTPSPAAGPSGLRVVRP